VVPCSAELGGVIVVSANSLIHVAQTARRVILPVNGWQARVSDHALPSLTEEEKQRNLKLEGSYAVFVDEKTLFVLLNDGTVYPVEIHADGRTVSRLSIGSAVARTAVPTIVRSIDTEHLFVGSTVGPSVLLRTSHMEEEVQDEDIDMTAAPAAVVDEAKDVEMDDDDGKRPTFFFAGPAVDTVYVRSLRSIVQPSRRTERRGCERYRSHSQEANSSPPVPLRLDSSLWPNIRHDFLAYKSWGKFVVHLCP
jgi:hypothetical protein